MARYKIKNLLLAGVGFTALTTMSALAADMPGSRPLPMPRAPVFVPFFSWTGFYVGMNAAYAFGNSNWNFVTTGVGTGDFDVNGAMVGGTLGYNMQFGSAISVEADIDWSNVKGSTTTLCPLGCQTSNTWFGTARGRIGYAFDRFLPYFTAGAAFGDIRTEATGFSGTTKTQFGWTVGLGMEYAFAGNWSTKLEYLYADMGTVQCPAANCGATIESSLQLNIIRGGLNYKF